MSQKSNSKEQSEPKDPHLEQIIDKIKHPPALDDTLRQQDRNELASNPTHVPEMLNQSDDLRTDLTRD